MPSLENSHNTPSLPPRSDAKITAPGNKTTPNSKKRVTFISSEENEGDVYTETVAHVKKSNIYFGSLSADKICNDLTEILRALLENSDDSKDKDSKETEEYIIDLLKKLYNENLSSNQIQEPPKIGDGASETLKKIHDNLISIAEFLKKSTRSVNLIFLEKQIEAAFTAKKNGRKKPVNILQQGAVEAINSALESYNNNQSDFSITKNKERLASPIANKEKNLLVSIKASLNNPCQEKCENGAFEKIKALIKNTKKINFVSPEAKTLKEEILKKYKNLDELNEKKYAIECINNAFETKGILAKQFASTAHIEAIPERISSLRKVIATLSKEIDESIDFVYENNPDIAKLPTLPVPPENEEVFFLIADKSYQQVEKESEKYHIDNDDHKKILLCKKFDGVEKTWRKNNSENSNPKLRSELIASALISHLEYRQALYEIRKKINSNDETAEKKLTATQEMILYVKNISNAVGKDGRITVECLESIKKPEHWKSSEAKDGKLGELRERIKSFRDGLHYKEIQEAKAAVKIAKEDLKNWQKVKGTNNTERELKLIKAQLNELIAGYKQTIDLHPERDQYKFKFFWEKKIDYTAHKKLDAAVKLLGKVGKKLAGENIELDQKNLTTSDGKLGKIYNKLAAVNCAQGQATSATPNPHPVP